MRRPLSLALVPLIAAACASAGASTNVAGRAADTTAAAGSARISYRARIFSGGDKVDYSGRGVFDFASGRGRALFDLSQLSSEADGPTRLVFGGSGYWLRAPNARRWQRFDLATTFVRDPVGQVSQLTQSPAQQLDLLRAAGHVVELGKGRVHAVPVTHYKGTVDVRRAVELQTDGLAHRRAVLAAVDRLVRQTGLATLPADFWVDRDGRVRRITIRIGSDGAGGFGGSLKLTLELSHFGARVTGADPPA